MENIAVIDLGTNTFHLLIIRNNGSDCSEIILRNRIPSKLFQEDNEILSPEAISRSLSIMDEFKKNLLEHKVKEVRAVGTAALRNTPNGNTLTHAINQETGIPVRIISGEKEAEYIFKGVNQSIHKDTDSFMIMDIGGGSVEFIAVENSSVESLKSFPLGVAYLYQNFPMSNPVTEKEIKSLRQHIRETLKPMISQKEFKTKNILIGSSGSFDVLRNYFYPASNEKSSYSLDYTKTREILTTVIHSRLKERKKMTEIPEDRLELIIVAFVLIEEILSSFPIDSVMTSDFALKEGVLIDMINP